MWGIFWTQTQSFSSGNYETIEINDKTITCKEQIRGIYWNNTRGSSVLRPLDPWTLENFRQMDGNSDDYDDVVIENGLFTSCYSWTKIKKSNYLENGIYWQVKFTGSRIDGSLIAWAQYDKSDNDLKDKRTKALSYLANTPVPIGYVYDTHGGGIGFVGWILSGDNIKDQNHQDVLRDINNGSGINNIFDTQTDPDKLVWSANGNTGSIQENNNVLANLRTAAKNNLMKIWLAGNAMSSKGSMNIETIQSLVKNMQGANKQKSTIISSNKMNVGDVINQANRSANKLCNDSYKEENNIDFKDLDSINCIKTSDKVVSIDSSLRSIDWKKERKTIIASEGTNILLSGSIKEDYLDIFIQEWNLYVKNATGSLLDFDKSGQLSDLDSGWNPVTSGMNLNGNFVVNGLIAGYSWDNDNNSYIGSFPHKIYIHGKVASLNSIKEPAKGRKLMVKRRFDSCYNNRDNYKKHINLENWFKWRCHSAIGEGTDWVNCENAGEYSNKPIIFIPNRYESQILK